MSGHSDREYIDGDSRGGFFYHLVGLLIERGSYDNYLEAARYRTLFKFQKLKAVRLRFPLYALFHFLIFRSRDLLLVFIYVPIKIEALKALKT